MNNAYLNALVAAALAEDMGSGDITTNSLVPSKAVAQADLVFKSEGVICGLLVAETVFKTLSPRIQFQKLIRDGSKIKKGKVVARIKGPAQALLTGERVALNFLSHLSGIATNTRTLVDQIKPYSTHILDTRKTTPLLRFVERYAVEVGGGKNHRFDLSSMAMIKDNHRLLLRHGLKQAVDIVKQETGKKVILEVDTFEEFKEALTSKAEVILLDNMSPALVQKAVKLRNQLKSLVLLEASGGINIRNIRRFAKTGVDRISVGSLTSIKQGIDISLDFKI